MYLVAIAWLYVAVMMALAEATHAQGSVLGAVITFLLYGLGPVALLMYLLGTPGRLRERKRREAQADTAAADALPADAAKDEVASDLTLDPDRRGHAPAVAVKPGVASE